MAPIGSTTVNNITYAAPSANNGGNAPANIDTGINFGLTGTEVFAFIQTAAI